MPLDPQAQALLDRLAALGMPPLHTLSVAETRQAMAMLEALRGTPVAVSWRAANVRNLPPALVVTAEFDPLRDEGEAYAARLEAGGVPAIVNR